MSPSAPSPVTFDLEKSKLTSSPRMAWTILSAVGIAAFGIGAVYFEIGSMKGDIAKLPELIEQRAQITEEKQTSQRKIDCLQQQIANTKSGWICPDAIAKAEPPPVRKSIPRKIAKKENGGFLDLFSAPATAAQPRSK